MCFVLHLWCVECVLFHLTRLEFTLLQFNAPLLFRTMHLSFQSLRGVVAGAVACAGAGSKSMLKTAHTCNGVISIYHCIAFFFYLKSVTLTITYLRNKIKYLSFFFSFFTGLTIRFSFALIIWRLFFDTASFLWGNQFGLREFSLCDGVRDVMCHVNRQNMYGLVHKRRHTPRRGIETSLTMWCGGVSRNIVTSEKF